MARQLVAEVSAHHHEIALGEILDAGDAPHQGQAVGDEREHRAHRQPVQPELDVEHRRSNEYLQIVPHGRNRAGPLGPARLGYVEQRTCSNYIGALRGYTTGSEAYLVGATTLYAPPWIWRSTIGLAMLLPALLNLMLP